MAEKNLNTRIVHKHDTEANWLKATNFIPKQGELIIYDVDENNLKVRVKIGDGVSNVNVLAFYEDVGTLKIENFIDYRTEINTALETKISSTDAITTEQILELCV